MQLFLAERLSRRYQGGIHSFHGGAHVCFLVYDVTNKDRLDDLLFWKAELDRCAPTPSWVRLLRRILRRYLTHRTSVAIIGTKCDGTGREDDGAMIHCIEEGR